MHRVRLLPLLLVLGLMLPLLGCKNKAPVHPNAINPLDDQAYTVLTDLQAALTEAQNQFQQGKLPAGSKDAINAAGAVYNVGRTDWLAYRDVATGVKSGDLAALSATLTSDIQQAKAALAQLVAIIKKLTSTAPPDYILYGPAYAPIGGAQ